MRRKISDIRIGPRFRKHLGDIDALAESIEATGGPLHPIVLTPKNELVVGRRRLAACERAGAEEVPVIVREVDDILRAQLAENAEREPFLPSEIYEIYRTREAEERAAAKQRQATAGPSQGKGKKSGPGKLPEAERGQVRDKIARLAGVSPRTLDDVVAVCRAAEEEPEKYGDLVVKMDRTGKANGARKTLKVAQQREAILREPPPLPGRGPYRVFVADVPWPYGADPYYCKGASPFPEMSIADICALPVADIGHPDCILFHWCTNRFLREAFQVLEAWGFEYRTTLTWAKDHHNGLGQWLWGQTEHVLIATRGKPTVVIGNWTTLLHGPVRAHSQKPEEFYEFVESYAPAPRYAELFARARRPNWDGHGDELKPLDDKNGKEAVMT